MKADGRELDAINALPYAVALVVGGLILWLRNDRAKSYAAFLRNSPGLRVDTSGIQYGPGHPAATRSGSGAAD
jgi:hypothetical protein